MKKISVIVLVLASLFIITSCQQIFTYSALEWAQRDPANLSPEQQIAYAESALASGDQAAIEAAYDALSSSSDPDTQALASQLAVSASGIEQAITEAITTMTFDASSIASIDATWLTNAESAMYAADAGGAEITPEEYLSVTAGLVVLAAQANGNDVSTLVIPATGNKDGTDLEKAMYYADAAGFSQTDLEGMFGL